MDEIIIDTSYMVYHRYNATLTWFKFKHDDIDFDNLHTNDEFITAFKKHLTADLIKLKKKWKTNKIMFCKDARRSDLWRTDIFPQYKATRKTATSFNTNFFGIVDEYIEENKYNSAWGDKLEADDVAYLYANQLGITTKLVFITGDCDYLQCKSDTWHIYTLKGVDLSEKSCGTAKNDLLKKIITGDKSDNIAPICKPLKGELVDTLINLSEEELTNWLNKPGNEKTKACFELNQTLIDWKKIPVEYHIIQYKRFD